MVNQRVSPVRGRSGLVVLLAGALIALALAFLWIGDLRAQNGDEPIHACVSSNHTRIVSGPDDCRNNEQHVSWNAQGRAGPAGPPGQDGAQGPAGEQGPPGATDVNVHVSDEGGVGIPLTGFIKFQDVNGEATEEGFEGWSRILAVEHDITTPAGSGSGGSGGAASFAPIKVVKELDTATNHLFQATPEGTAFGSVMIKLVEETETSRQTYYSYELTNVTIKRHSLGEPDPQTGRPLETLELVFDEIVVTYTQFDENGTQVEGSWIIGTGTP